ncbi:MAG: helix-turn-helix domain-containing protein [Flavobacteriaceae bacterium]|nr:helix-turn-helix domain-containing protein [Flavobacteriaceae bacterium]
MVAGEAISKEKLTSDIIKKYISHKTETIQKQFKEVNVTLIEDEADVERYTKKEKAPKAPKKSTVQETYELWLEKNSIKEIAGIRKFTEETILSHLTKLIIAKTIRINDVLPEDKIQELTEAFYGYKEESISPLKEKYGDKFTWEELRMFKASLNI